MNRWTPLRVIQPNGDRIPLFLVHGIAGGVGQYQAIGNELGPNQPVYGLRQSMEFDESIESMAASLLDSIRTVQRHGPYCLGGYCFGGVVAFEIARQLEMAGEEPGLLVMFDSPLPLRRRLTVLDNGARNGSFLSALVTGGNGAGGAPVPSRREMAGRMTQKLRSWFNTVFGKGDRKPRADRFFETYYSKTEQETVRKNIALLRSWTPGNWGGRIVFFQSAEHRVFESVAPRVWRQFAGKGVEVVPVAARHNELLAKENLQPVVQALRSELDCVSEN